MRQPRNSARSIAPGQALGHRSDTPECVRGSLVKPSPSGFTVLAQAHSFRQERVCAVLQSNDPVGEFFRRMLEAAGFVNKKWGNE